MNKRLNDFKKRFNRFKNINPQTDENEVLKPKVLDDLKIFLMNCITFTRINTLNRKMV